MVNNYHASSPSDLDSIFLAFTTTSRPELLNSKLDEKGTNMKTGYLKEWQKMTRRKKAQAMIEFALILPVLLLVIFGIFEFGRLFYAWIIIENATRVGLRYATTGNYDPAYCTSGCTRLPIPRPHGFHPSRIKRVIFSSVCLMIKL